jgi:hypothetical protein
LALESIHKSNDVVVTAELGVPVDTIDDICHASTCQLIALGYVQIHSE